MKLILHGLLLALSMGRLFATFPAPIPPPVSRPVVEVPFTEGDLASTLAAAEQGDARAESDLAFIYREGKGVPKDPALAAVWFRKLADRGYPFAQFLLGQMYANGDGVEKNDELANHWLLLAAQHGNGEAQVFMGKRYAVGHGVAQNVPESVRWFREAAAQDNATAQYCLSLSYAYGEGVKQDFAEAIRWARLADEHGYKGAYDHLHELLLLQNQAVLDASERAAMLHAFGAASLILLGAGSLLYAIFGSFICRWALRLRPLPIVPFLPFILLLLLFGLFLVDNLLVIGREQESYTHGVLSLLLAICALLQLLVVGIEVLKRWRALLAWRAIPRILWHLAGTALALLLLVVIVTTLLYYPKYPI